MTKTVKAKVRTAGDRVKLGAAAALVSGLAAWQAVAATADLRIIAKLIRAIDVTVNTALDFGTLAMTVDRAGHATMDPSVNRLLIGNNGSLSLAGGLPSVGRLRIKGAEFPVHISIEDASVKLTNGVNTVTVDNFNIQSAHGGAKMTFTPVDLQAYSLTVPVGATLKTQPGQASGTYTGVTRIFASYQ